MSLAAIQDNLVKTSLVQHTQTRQDDVARGQEIAQVAQQREQNRQEDQVVIHTRETDNTLIRPDEEREKEERKKKRRALGEEEDETEAEETTEEQAALSEYPQHRGRSRTSMRRINIVI